MEILLPGESFDAQEFKLGPGLMQVDDTVVAFKAGLVKESRTTVWIENSQKRYLPLMGEPVVGVVVGKNADSFKVEIGGPFIAVLDSCSFEGATKRNRPNLKIGAIVYGRITLSNRDMDPEMECIGLSGKSEGYGDLLEGHLIQTSLQMARR